MHPRLTITVKISIWVDIPKTGICAPSITLSTMNTFLANGGGSTPAILTIAGSDSGGGAGIQVSTMTKKTRLLMFDSDVL